ncbi:MAG: hypothetical protein HN478_16345 [Rhodospirillaceae bacterium]|jgi:hypothetical protein|nr:hypothetical protein [Rhodospirillaceae bacterium]MBT4490123.1 hypothetical protein [Rhodospirillaceae bacterium]MBT5192415.1 hypothetical protein [Rhodospirillaceae bacterium]MBT6427220.1 hypothetical protein [Rhodospirillaceae bacterium]
MDQPYQATRPAREDHGTVVLMSLYLILVAFFIMLNSMAQLEESRIEEAMGSVKAEFRNELAIAKAGPTVAHFDGQAEVVSNFHGEIRQLFQANLPIDHVDPVRRGDVLSFRVPTDVLFRTDAVAARPRGRPFLDAMAASLKRTRPGYQAIVEMVLGTGVSLPDGGNGGGDFELHRATSLAHALRRRGVDAAFIRTGLIAGDPGQISFIFQVRDEAQSRLTFSNLVARQ